MVAIRWAPGAVLEVLRSCALQGGAAVGRLIGIDSH